MFSWLGEQGNCTWFLLKGTFDAARYRKGCMTELYEFVVVVGHYGVVLDCA
jgi:hypothetical protein